MSPRRPEDSPQWGGKRPGAGRKPGSTLPPEEKRIKLAHTLTPEILDWLHRKAKEQGLSRSEYLIRLLDAARADGEVAIPEVVEPDATIEALDSASKHLMEEAERLRNLAEALCEYVDKAGAGKAADVLWTTVQKINNTLKAPAANLQRKHSTKLLPGRF